MIYLDYSSTTKVDERVLKEFNDVCINAYGNYNSTHSLGKKSKSLIEESTNIISNILNINEDEIIYTSGATESNNMAIKGIVLNNKLNKKHIISTKLEHSSINNILNYLSSLGFDIDFVSLNEDGTVDLDNLKSLIKDNTILVTIVAVDSELGIRQPIEKIGKIVKKHSNCYFHTDITQCIGKNNINLENVHLASFSAHKFFGLKGVGGLYKRKDVFLIPLIHGGKSISNYRGGTPSTELIVSMSKALEIFNKENDIKYVEKLNKYLTTELRKIKKIVINNTKRSLPYTVNISVLNVEQDLLIQKLSENDIYLSSKSSCNQGSSSSIIFEIYKDQNRAKTSLRISISYKTKLEELQKFIKVFNNILNNIN